MTDQDRIIEMAWEDRTPFEAIELQFGVPESEVIRLMRRELSSGAFKRWRRRVSSAGNLKHVSKRNPEVNRFKCTRQRTISHNRISKRA